MGLAAGSIGAIAPSTAQYAAAVSVGAVHFGSATATLDTGSPIAPTGIAVPSFADVQSASVIVLALADIRQRRDGCLWRALRAAGQRWARLASWTQSGAKRGQASKMEFIVIEYGSGLRAQDSGKSFEIYSKVFPEP